MTVKRAHLFNPIYWVVWTFWFVLNWFLSRPYTSVAPAIPAVALAIGLGVLVFEVQFREKATKQAKYRQVLSVALSAKDYETAEVALGTLTDMAPEDFSLRFQRGLLDMERGNEEEAFNQMYRLAVGKRFGQAALWLVTNRLDLKNMGEWSQEDHQKFRAWTEIALQDKSVRSEIPAKTLMATYLYGTGARRESIPYFEQVVPHNPELAYPAAVICRDLGDTRRSEAFAVQAETYYGNLLNASPLNVKHRINMAKAIIVQNKEERAATLLMDGYNLTKSEDLKIAAAECLATYADRLGKSDRTPNTLMHRLKLSRQALELAPSSTFVMDSIVALLFEIRNNQNQEIQAVRSALVQGLDEDSLHFVRGTVALLSNDFEQAKVHLEIASKKNPNLPGILNNLAVAISQSSEPDLEAALKLANMAMEAMPNHPYFRDTRGQILVRLKRYTEAIPDLEAGLQAQELGPSIHRSLAKAYEELGQLETAAEHRRLAQATPTTALPPTP